MWLGDELNNTRSKQVEVRKKFGKLLSESRSAAKEEECYYCGKKCSSFCNSHSIPAFSLKNIAVNGKIYNHNKLVTLPFLDDDKGVNQSGTFQLICKECDSKIFRDYENPDNYKNKPTSKMIAQIAMKNYLKSIAKRKLEIALYDIMYEKLNLSYYEYTEKQNVSNSDLQEYTQRFKRAKTVKGKHWDGEYYLFYYQKLNYVVPIAFQSNVALPIDLENNIVNDIYYKSPKYHIQDVHICVFPLEASSVVMMFIDSKDKRYRSFYKQFTKLSYEDKLAVVNYIIFNLSEDIYINKEVNEEVLEDKELVEISKKITDMESSDPNLDTKSIIKERFNFSHMNKIPNLLLEKYKVR